MTTPDPAVIAASLSPRESVVVLEMDLGPLTSLPETPVTMFVLYFKGLIDYDGSQVLTPLGRAVAAAIRERG